MQYGLGMLAALLLASCSSDLKEEDNDGYRLSNGKVDLTISVILPQPETVKVSTRTTPANLDSDIANMDLLIFDEDAKFMKRVKVESDQLTVTETGVSFTVKLDATSQKRIIHLVANGRSYDGKHDRVNFDEELVTGRAESDAISKLYIETTGVEGIVRPILADYYEAFDIMRLLMWGRFVLDNGITARVTRQAQLLRNTACIEVQTGTASAANGLDGFRILDVTVDRAPNRGFLAPEDCTGIVSTPAAANPVTDAIFSDGGLFKNWPDYLPAHNNNNHYYMYERHNTKEDYMSVLIYAEYKNDNGLGGYYRIELVDGNGIPLDVIRNHKYVLTIIGASGPGYLDPVTALEHLPSNALKVEITDKHADLPFIATNGGDRILAMSNNEYIQYGECYSAYVELCELYYTEPPHYPLPMAQYEGYGLDHSIGYEVCGIGQLFWEPGKGPAHFYVPKPYPWYVVDIYSPKINGYIVQDVYTRQEKFLSDSIKCITDSLKFSVHDLYLPFRATFIPDITYTFQEEGNFYIHDLVEPTDKNWNIRILDPSSTPWLRLRSSKSDLSPMVTELGSKYNSHAYLYVTKGSDVVGYILKTSVSNGKPVVTRIAIAQPPDWMGGH